MGSAHNIFRYNNLSGANSVAVCVLALSLAKQSTTVINKNTKNIVNAMRWLWNEVYFLLSLSQRLSPICSSRQTASCLAIVRLHKRKVFVGFAHTHDLRKGRPNFYNFLQNTLLLWLLKKSAKHKTCVILNNAGFVYIS